MYDHILVPTDGSDGTKRSIDHAATIARDSDATVHVLYVIDQRLYRAASKDTTDEVVATLQEEGGRAIEDAVTQIEEYGVDVTSERVRGIPYKSILEHAEEEPTDLVVIGTHGRTGRDRIATLGSVTERVVKNANVPVLVVDIDEE